MTKQMHTRLCDIQTWLTLCWKCCTRHFQPRVHHIMMSDSLPCIICIMLRRYSKQTVQTLFTMIYRWCSIYTSYYGQKFRSFSAPAACITVSTIRIIIAISGLFRTLHSDFEDFPGKTSFSRTFQVLEILQTQLQDFPAGMGMLHIGCKRKVQTKLRNCENETKKAI